MSRFRITDSVASARAAGRRLRRGGLRGDRRVGSSGARSIGQSSRQYSRRAKITGSIAVTLTGALVFGALYGYIRYRDVWDSIKRISVAADLPVNRPAGFGNALNILVIGSDSRAGQNGAIGGRVSQGQRSDTVMVVHISPAPHRIVVLSFPRDSVVPILKCAPEQGNSGQQAQPGQIEQLNATFAFGGPGCLWHTIEETTHIRLDDFVQLDFVGFEKVINDLGGVNVCLPVAVNNPVSGLHLAKGRSHIYGKQALAFWRTREALGLGSDLQRIQRDQFLMISLLHGIERSGLLSSPVKVASVVGDAAHSMTADPGLTLTRMLQIATGMRGLASKSTQFIQIPTVAYPANTNWVQWTPQDARLFAAIAHNVQVPKVRKSRKPVRSAPAVVLAKPSTVKVEVLNGSGVAGVASTASADLTSRGFVVVGSTNAASFSYTGTVVQYASGADLLKARAVAADVSGASVQQNARLAAGTVDMIVGSSFGGMKPAAAAKSPAAAQSPAATQSPAAAKSRPTTSSSSVSNLAKNYGGLTGTVNVCNDQAAFAG